MRVSEQVLRGVLRQGGCIRSFWRRSARLTGTPAPVVAKGLVCSEEWTQVVGTTGFGGAVWRLVPDAQIYSVLSPQENGERDEQ